MEETKELYGIDAVGAGNACRRIALTLKHGNKFEAAYHHIEGRLRSLFLSDDPPIINDADSPSRPV